MIYVSWMPAAELLLHLNLKSRTSSAEHYFPHCFGVVGGEQCHDVVSSPRKSLFPDKPRSKEDRTITMKTLARINCNRGAILIEWLPLKPIDSLKEVHDT